MNRSVLILGGGIAGLTAAFRLAAAGLAVTIIEESAHLGGGLSQTSSPLLLDAHHATWSLLDQLDKGSLLRRLRHTPLEFLQANGARTQFLHLFQKGIELFGKIIPDTCHSKGGNTV